MIGFAQFVSDLTALKHKLGDKYKGQRVVTPSLSVLNAGIANGFEKIEFLHPDRETLETGPKHYYEADRLARILDSDYGYLVSRELNLDFIARGWVYQNLLSVIYNGLRSKYLSCFIARKYCNENILFHSPTSNPYFYFDSWFNKEIFASDITAKNQVVVRSKGLIKEFEPGFEYDFGEMDIDHIAHLPTIYYEKKLIHDLFESKCNIALLNSQHWDIPYKHPSVRSFDCKIKSDILVKHVENRQGIDTFVSKLCDYFNLNNQTKEKLVVFYSALLKSQLDLARQIIIKNDMRTIKSISVADHDTSITGLLLTLSEHLRIPAEIYAHSLVPTGQLADSRYTRRKNQLRKLNCDTSLSGIVKSEPNTKDFSAFEHGSNKNVILLLNEFEDTAGIVTEDYQSLFNNLTPFINRLKNSGFNVLLRPKPHHPYSTILKFQDAKADGPLSEWLSWAGVAISLGIPTTALLQFDMHGARTYHAQTTTPTTRGEEFLSKDTLVLVERSWEQIFHSIHNQLCNDIITE